MKTRILSGLIMAPFLALLYFGGYVLMAGCIFVGAVGLYEFYKGFHSLDVHPSYPIGLGSLALLYLINIILWHRGALGWQQGTYYYTCWLFLTVVASMLYLFAIEHRKLEDAMATITGIVYVVFFSFHMMLVDQSNLPILVWIIVLGAFGTDICAYFAGVFLGKHKLCPKISPKKTIEGSLGGVLGSVLLCGLFGVFFAPEAALHCFILGGLCGIFSQFGDLTASIFKRKMGIKDYGNLIPGHGGILDRFDSVLFTAPLVFYYIHLVIIPLTSL
ncbi:MAG: phosphatidate cytidylyltransferase [Clostridiales bacterium]|nr:phosphatidate cytidylyltransferase [Clostridiales bacterium]